MGKNIFSNEFWKASKPSRGHLFSCRKHNVAYFSGYLQTSIRIHVGRQGVHIAYHNSGIKTLGFELKCQNGCDNLLRLIESLSSKTIHLGKMKYFRGGYKLRNSPKRSIFTLKRKNINIIRIRVGSLLSWEIRLFCDKFWFDITTVVKHDQEPRKNNASFNVSPNFLS